MNSVPAQEWVHEMRPFGVQDGLPHRNVKVVFIDRSGMLWAATQFELSRFDGSYLQVYDRERLGDAVDNIKSIAQDDSGALWLWGESGLHLFDPDEERAERVSAEGATYSEADLRSPLFPLCDENGQLFFNPSGRATLMTARGGAITETYALPYEPPFNLLALTAGKRLWARSARWLLLLGEQGQELQRFHVPELGAVKNAFASREDELFLFAENAEEGKVRQLLRIGHDGRKENLSSNWELPLLINVFFEAGSQVIWLEMEDRWEIRSLSGEILEVIPDNAANAAFYANSSSSWMQATGQGGELWLATEHGVLRLSSRPSPFKTYFKGVQKWQSSMRGIWSDGLNVVAAAELTGVLRARRAFPTDTLAKDYNHYIAGRGLPATANHTLRSDYRGVYRDADGYLWLGHQRVVLRYDETEDSYRSYPPAFTYDVDFGINPWCFVQTADGTTWVGAQPGLKYIPPEGDSLLAFTAAPPYAALNDAAVYQFHLDDSGNCWMATSAGLFCLSVEEEGRIVQAFHSQGEGVSLAHDDLFGLADAGEGKFWLATNGHGLILFDPLTGKTQHWTTKDGLSDDVLYAVYEDRYGYLWLSSDYGLMHLDTGRQLINTFLEGHGVPNNEFNRVAHYETGDGDLLFGTINGLVQLDPANFVDYTLEEVPGVQLLHFQKKEKGKDRFINHTVAWRRDSVIYLNPGDESVRLTLALPVFQSATPEFFYRLDHGEWTKLADNQLLLGQLPYGEHDLYLKGRIAGGRFSESPLSLKVIAVKPFYLRSWFLSLLLLSVLVLIRYAFWLRTQKMVARQLSLEARIREATAQLKEDRNLIAQQAEELAQVNRMKTRFFANISHELRTPLTLMMGPLSSLKKSKRIAGDDQELLELAEDNSRELLQKVNAILDLAKLDVNGMDVTPVDTDLYQLCKQLLRKFKKRAQNQETTLRLSYDYDPERHFLLDAPKVTTVLSNLLSNALKFTGKGKTIHVRVRVERNEVVLSVEDNGTGIPDADLPRLFDRFFQSTNNYQLNSGSGIGLALCKELVELMDGQLSVSSQEGKGSTFTFGIPQAGLEVKTADLDDPARAQRPGSQQSPVDPYPIMEAGGYLVVVEDNPGMRSYLASILQPDHTVQLAENGLEALAFLKVQHYLPALIITDLMMPRMDGLTLVRALKDCPDYRLIPVIVLSARSTANDRVEVLRYGVDDYLEKPFDAIELSVRINRLLENAAQRLKAAREMDTDADPLADPKENSAWLEALETFVIDHLSDNRLTASFLAEAFHMSTRNLQRRLNAEAGVSPGSYIREVRLNEAIRLLEKRTYATVKEVAARVGFRSPEYFSSCFRNRFGRLPSSYL